MAKVRDVFSVDDDTGAIITIDSVHHEVHEGEMFHASYTASSVANTNSVNVLLKVGADVEVHTVWEVFAGGKVTVYLYEDPTIGTVEDVPQYGTEITAYNMHRGILTAPASTVYHTPTVTDPGSTALVNGRILPGGTSPTTRVGGGIRSGAEWILAPDTLYLMKVTNSSGGAIDINIVLEWYEEA